MRFFSIICWIGAVVWALIVGLASQDPSLKGKQDTGTATLLLILLGSVPAAGAGYFLWSKAGKNAREEQAEMIAKAIAAAKEQDKV